MITLYNSGRALGLPDLSPFVVKAEVLLKMAGVEYQLDPGGFTKAPKGKIPYMRDGATIVADSFFIRKYLEQHYQARFDGDYSAEQLALAWSVERMLEEHLYFALVHTRWMDDASFALGPAHFFDSVPAFIRPLVVRIVRGKVRKMLDAQGMGRHSEDDRATLACGDLDALSRILGAKPYLLGDHPCGADATVFAFVAGTLCPAFKNPIRTHAESLVNLVAYRDRMMSKYFPELSGVA